jgi:hypothetical protein
VSAGRPTAMSMTASAHMRPETEILTRSDATTNRGWLGVDGPGGSYMTVFAERADLVRLRDALTALVAEIDTERAAHAESRRADESAA